MPPPQNPIKSQTRKDTAKTGSIVPDPVPPAYGRLKPLHLSTSLAIEGQPSCTIVLPADGRYNGLANRIQNAIREPTGVRLPVVPDTSPKAAVPIRGNVILPGNRSTNRTISELYNRYYTLLDLRYPGPGGYVLRTLHNPFGNGCNVIFLGGSDDAGVEQAANLFIDELANTTSLNASLAVGRLMKIQIGSDVRIPEKLEQFETWEDSAKYGSIGYFGWNSISKRMAMYYMTGDDFHAREVIRLAFPDEKAFGEIAEIDGERIENKAEPLSGPYHYNAHLMILFWDLIEESPVFSDEERLRVTNAFSRQLLHRLREHVYGTTSEPPYVGSRHGQWSAISLYCLGRYFQKDYPHPIWQHCLDSARLQFQPLKSHAWVAGENDNLFWYNTGIAPILTYMLLTGDRTPLENGNVSDLLRGLEILISGRIPDWALATASIGFLHKAAYLLQDGRYPAYLQRTSLDLSIFRLGQSFYPEPCLSAKPPVDLMGKWSVKAMPEPMWRARKSRIAQENSFMFASFRSAGDASGDFILVDGFNGASRNPYHTFPILELRLNGYTLLKGHQNQLLIRSDGLVEPHIAMDSGILQKQAIGSVASITGEVPDAAFCCWRRTLVQRLEKYALIVDELDFRESGENMDVEFNWETECVPKSSGNGFIAFSAPIESPACQIVSGGQTWSSDPLPTKCKGNVASMNWTGKVEAGERKYFFSLIGMQPGIETPTLGCLRLSENAAVLKLPAPAIVVSGDFEHLRAQVITLAEDHLYAKNLTDVRFAENNAEKTIISATDPVDVDWNFTAGSLHLHTPTQITLRLALSNESEKQLRSENFSTQKAGKLLEIDIPAGKWQFEGIKPDAISMSLINSQLRAYLYLALDVRKKAETKQTHARQHIPQLQTRFETTLPGEVTDMISVPLSGESLIGAASGNTIYLLDSKGNLLPQMATDGSIRMLRWWHEAALLLAGCADEQVVAFNLDGSRRWAFTSVMDPAVFQAAKTYWFKSEPGHEGIHGLYTGSFLNGESQAFVGSACTLEILDANGNLIKRLPQFWGKVSHFALIDAPDGSLNLLAARKYNGVNRVAIINNRTLDPSPRGFDSVPPGHTFMGGWSAMNRHHIFYEDMDGDGIKEVISDINGTWNRVTIWRADGSALYDVSLGPGDFIPAKNIRDMDICDLNDDGKMEIVVATSAGTIIALDHRCQKIWARRLDEIPVVMKGVHLQPARIVIGCESGAVIALDASGEFCRRGQVKGIPTCIDAFVESDGKVVVPISTKGGEIKGFLIGD
ncbi:hypothetical protein JXJ21_00405 [candidate division KSB1 bacterium]|nr:hypothetical protein [candidate division KSB1 bacterium]